MSSGAYVSESEFDAVVRELENLTSQVREGKSWSDVEDPVWRLYVRVETLVTKMKLRMAVERPGEFIDAVVREPMTEHIGAALSSAQRARDDARVGEFRKALDLLRDCRNELRIFLDSARKARLKQARKKAAARTLGSPSSQSS